MGGSALFLRLGAKPQTFKRTRRKNCFFFEELTDFLCEIYRPKDMKLHSRAKGEKSQMLYENRNGFRQRRRRASRRENIIVSPRGSRIRIARIS